MHRTSLKKQLTMLKNLTLLYFKVALDANKAEIAAAVAQLFEVKVDSVRTCGC